MDTLTRSTTDSRPLPHVRADASTRRISFARRTWRGREDDPAWTRPALFALLGATALLYLWDLGSSGWANSFYAAAAQAGSESWKAFFFGSSDAANAITVDKTPLSLWPMALSVRLFGLSSWSILVPQALEGVATVAVLYSAVRRTTGSAVSGLLAGVALAVTPVAVLMFRFDNPDSMLVLLLTGAAAATLRAVDDSHESKGRPRRWLALAGALVGLAFLAKMMQAFLVLPAFALAYLLCAGIPVARRLGHLSLAFGSMVLAGGWWVLIVSLWPAASRPYIGGSQHNSILELTLGYNGFGRLSGNETGSVGGGGGQGGGNWGATGLGRMFNSEMGGQIAWLVPAALTLLVAGLWFGRRDRRVRAGLIVWGGWLLVTGLTFSLMAGIFHAYYTVALAPAVAALVAIGGAALWRHRTSWLATTVLATTTAGTAVWAYVLLGRSADFDPWLRPLVLLIGLGAAAALLVLRLLPARLAAAALAIAVVSGLAGPAAYALDTAATPHTGSIPSAGPTTSTGPGGGGPGGFPGGGRGGPGGATGGQVPPQMGTQQNGTGTQTGTQPTGTTGRPTGNAGANTGGSAGGLLQGSTPGAALTKALQEDADEYTWAAAAIGSNVASGYQLASGLPVMAIGGFNGSDPSPTLAQFTAYVAAGRIHWFIASGGGGGGGGGIGAGGSTSSSITSWVEAHFTATTVDGVTMYDVSGGTS